MGPWNPLPSSESQRLRNLYESIGMPLFCCDTVILCGVIRKVPEAPEAIFSFPACAKIHDHNGIIRNFQFRKFLPAKSNKIPLIPLYKIFPELQQTFGENKNFSPVPFFTRISLSPDRISAVRQMIQFHDPLHAGVEHPCDLPERISRLHHISDDPRHLL